MVSFSKLKEQKVLWDGPKKTVLIVFEIVKILFEKFYIQGPVL
jgi:hypothetical protein